MQFACPSCSRILRVADDLAGKKVRCSACKSVVQVPAQLPQQPKTDLGAQEVPVLSEVVGKGRRSKAGKVAYVCGNCSTDLETTASLAGTVEPCPVCGHRNRVPEPARRRSRRYVVLGLALVMLGAAAVFFLWGPAHEGVVDLGGGVTMRFVFIPAGSITMGSTEEELKEFRRKWPGVEKDRFLKDWIADEKPARKVTISKAFHMGKHEVTVGQFRCFVAATSYKTDAEKGTGSKGVIVATEGGIKVAEDSSWRNPYFEQTDEHPVVCVSWNDARAFVDWLNGFDKGKPAGWRYRLPTEAEWEYACRGGTTTRYQWGDDPDKGKGWCNAADLTGKKSSPQQSVFNWDDGFLYTAPVGSFRANAFGLHDMHGNAAEWCQDYYGACVGGDQTDPPGPTAGEARVVRGGSWCALLGDCRSAYVYRYLREFRVNFLGFRVVLVPGP